MATAAPALGFEAIDREFRPKVLRYLARLAGPQQAPDLTQVTMLRVSEHLPRFRGESSLATWIYRIATNVAIDEGRRRSGVTESLDSILDAGAEAPPALQSDSAESCAARAEMSACVREFAGRLPAHYRAALVLTEVEGLSNAELAQALGVSVEAAKIRLHRARASLRRELSTGCTVLADERSEVACERRAVAR